MLFNSFIFLVLVLITFLLYYIKYFSRFQVQILILSSLVFYAYHKPALVLLLLASAGINIFTSYYVVHGNAGRKKLLATLGVLLNLSILIFFKYSPLISRTFFDAGSSVGEFLLTIPLPIGISFYTFQGISLMLDVYKGKYQINESMVPRSFIQHARRVLFFISFFPKLSAGPIVKAHDFFPQIGTKYLRDVQWSVCIKNLILGYFLKMVIADNMKEFTMWIEFPHFQGQTTISLLVMLFGYSCQIFADFAGCSLIAIGLARLFGYKLCTNFYFPYISSSFKDFWKRWHISLSSFLMEYLYIPLGGNRKGKVRTYLNLLATMLLGGLWHGAAWSYLAWGGIHGSVLAIERYFMSRSNEKEAEEGFWIRNFKRLFVFIVVTFAWLFFKLPDFTHVVEYFKTLYTNASFAFDIKTCALIMIYALPVMLYHLFYLHRDKNYIRRIMKFDYILYGIMLFFIFTNSGAPGAFIYFQF